MAAADDPAAHQSVLALIDTSPVLLLPSVLACRARAGSRPLHVALAGPASSDAAMQRLLVVLARHGIEASIHDRGETLETTVSAWLSARGADAAPPIVDLSSASGGTAARAMFAVQRDGRRACTWCWFNETYNEVHFSSGGVPEVQTIDIGSARSVPSAISPGDFMAIFGLERVVDDPYCGAGRDRLMPLASGMLHLALTQADASREFRRLLGAARARTGCRLAPDAIPRPVRPVIAELMKIDGWVRSHGSEIVFCGRPDTLGVFFLSGGWLEMVVSEAVRRALPDHQVQLNCGTTWGRRRRAEAEMDVAFVYHNALYLLSCKNDHLTDRFFPHLDRFRALTAEFGESRTRPVLLSTAELEPRHVRRCDAYEIGQISGRTLLNLIAASLDAEADALLNGLLTVSRGAPRAGIERAV